MKLGKISLAAVVAMGAFTTSAFAKDLSDAIKGVDVSGEIQWRYDNRIKDPGDSDGGTSEENHEFDASIMFKVPVSDQVTAVMDVIYSQDNNVYPESKVNKDTGVDESTYSFHSEEHGESAVYIDNFYFQYTTGKTIAMLGQMAIGAPFTDDMMMNGIKVLNQDIPDWTFAAVYANNLENDGDWGTDDAGVVGTNGAALHEQDLYTVAAIGSLGPVSLQGWYSYLTNAVDGHIYIQADATFKPVSLTAKYAMTMVDEDLDISNPGLNAANPELGVSDAVYYALEASAKLDVVKLGAGYSYMETDEDEANSFVTFENASEVDADIQKDKLLVDYSNTGLFSGEHTKWYLCASGKVAGIGMGIAYSAIDVKDSLEGSEVTLSAKFKAAGLSIKPYYAMANIEPDGASDFDDQKFRVDVEYKF